jgi:hypothetical protein
MKNMAKQKRLRWLLIHLSFFVLVDFMPSFGPPFFRYTGSNPCKHVWNFGWPFAFIIYDHESGFHSLFNIKGYIALALAQLFVLAVWTVIVAIILERWPNTSYIALALAQLFVLGVLIAIVAIIIRAKA